MLGIGRGEIAISTALGSIIAAVLTATLIKRGILKIKQFHQDRYLPNPLEEYSEAAFNAQEESLAQWKALILKQRQQILEAIAANAPPTEQFEHHSLYYGSAGISYLFWRLWRSEKENMELRSEYLELALKVCCSARSVGDNHWNFP